MAKRVVIVRHGDDPPDDRTYIYLHQAGFIPDVRRPFRGDTLGDVDDDVAGTIIHGGPFNAFAFEEHPFLRDEDRWIGACLKADVPLLGICQGAQQLAQHLGAWVGPHENATMEFGYYEVEPTVAGRDFLPQTLHMTQAHFHTFDIPEDAVHLASSEAFENQAFRYGEKAYAVQFHPEVTIEGFRRWQKTDRFWNGMPGVQTLEDQTRLGLQHDAAQADWFYSFLGQLFGTTERA